MLTVTRVEELRRMKGWTRPQLAKLAGVDAVTIWRIEVQGSKPFRTSRERIARALKSDPLFLWPAPEVLLASKASESTSS